MSGYTVHWLGPSDNQKIFRYRKQQDGTDRGAAYSWYPGSVHGGSSNCEDTGSLAFTASGTVLPTDFVVRTDWPSESQQQTTRPDFTGRRYRFAPWEFCGARKWPFLTDLERIRFNDGIRDQYNNRRIRLAHAEQPTEAVACTTTKIPNPGKFGCRWEGYHNLKPVDRLQFSRYLKDFHEQRQKLDYVDTSWHPNDIRKLDHVERHYHNMSRQNFSPKYSIPYQNNVNCAWFPQVA